MSNQILEDNLDPYPTQELPITTLQPTTGSRTKGPSSLVATDVSCWFGSRQVLDRCSLEMQSQQVTALIGPSGCGKSTFLRTLNRMHETIKGAKVAGTVQLGDLDIYGDQLGVTEVRVRIGMVFQKPNPFPSMSIRDNVLAGLKLSGTSNSDKDGLVEECLRSAGLWNEVKDRLHDGGMSLSGGQQQRLCIARSLAVKPQVLLLDEPCSALDPISTRVVEETVMQLCEQVTIVIVTHNMQQAQRVSSKCAFFLVEEQGQSGRIVEAGPTAKVFSNPDDQRTLDYVSGRFG
jgi:phosphate transport system ATP-binding protein